MQYTKKSLLLFLTLFLAISLAGNVYSFSKEDEKSTETEGSETEYKRALLEKEDEIDQLQQQLEAEKETIPATAEEERKQSAPAPETVMGELTNTAQRFIENAFENDPETYVTRKKMAPHYMTNSLYETLYASDGVDEEQQKVAVDIKEINVFADSENEKEAIVFYVYKEEILSSGYEEEKEMYVKLTFAVEGEQLKVAEIEPLENDYGGI